MQNQDYTNWNFINKAANSDNFGSDDSLTYPSGGDSRTLLDDEYSCLAEDEKIEQYSSLKEDAIGAKGHSTLQLNSGFNTVILYGNLKIMFSNINTNFRSCFCQLTHDGRLVIKPDNKGDVGIVVLIIEESQSTEFDTVFRLVGRLTRPMDSGGDLDGGHHEEIVCKLETEAECQDWLLQIERLLYSRLRHFQQEEVEFTRGELQIVEVASKGEVCLADAGVYNCFYLRNTFRVRNFQSPGGTTSFQVLSLTRNIDTALRTFVLESTRGQSFACRAPNVFQYMKWCSSIGRTIDSLSCSARSGDGDGDAVGSVGNFSEIKHTTDCLELGLSPNNLKKMRIKFHHNIRHLECMDNSGIVYHFLLCRCIAPSPELNLGCSLVLLTKFFSSASPSQSNDGQKVMIFVNPSVDSKLDWTKWLNIFSPDSKKLVQLLKVVVSEIEKRWLTANEALPPSKDPVSLIVNLKHFQDIFGYFNLTSKDLARHLSEVDIERLEILLDTILLFFPEPVMPYSCQGRFLAIGSQVLELIRTHKTGEAAKLESALIDIMESLPESNQNILQFLSVHVWRLTMNHRQKEQRTPTIAPDQSDSSFEANGRSQADHQDHHLPSSSFQNRQRIDAVIWMRLCRSIFRLHEQQLDDQDTAKEPTLPLVYSSSVAGFLLYQQIWLQWLQRNNASKSDNQNESDRKAVQSNL